jgi:hypothetical protein
MKMMKMKDFLIIICLFVPVLLYSGQISLKDHPSQGEWNFNPEKVWEIEKAGDDEFGTVGELLISDKHNIYLRDFKRNSSYIFNEKGAFLKIFAPQGKEAGQLPYYLNRFQAGDKIVLAAPDKLHFFSQDGVFIRAVENNLFLRFPLRFMNENKFIYAPNLPQSPANDTKLMLYDINSGQESLLVDFSGTEANGVNFPKGLMLMIPWLTPQVRLDNGGGKWVFGRSDQYKIFIADHAGKIQSSFQLERKKMTATLEDKRLQLAGLNLPEETKEKIISQLPAEMMYFSHLNSINGLIYVFAVTSPQDKTISQQIDIFSTQGEYLCNGKIEFGPRFKFNGFSNLVINGEYAYVILEDDQGKQTLAKYRIQLPQ